jgi:hypothetical protein
MSAIYRLFPFALALLSVSACTSMGPHDSLARQHHEYGAPEVLNVCLRVDEGIREDEARALVEDAWREEGKLYGVDVRLVQVKQWSRPAFSMEPMLQALREEPLEAPCDRIFALVGRNVGDFLWGLVGVEILGAVNDETLTHGYAVARVASLNQLLNPPTDVTRHEIYHLLGCGEHFHMSACYDQIAQLKAWKREHGGDFFPAWDLINNRMLASRDEVNDRLQAMAHGAVAKR